MRQHFRNKILESSITAQWIEIGIDLDKVNLETSLLACISFEPIHRLIFFSQREVDHRETVTGNITTLCDLREFGQYLTRFILLSHAGVGVADERQHSG